MNDKRERPWRQRPLNVAGESLYTRVVEELILGQMAPWFFVPLILVLFVLWEWARWVWAIPAKPPILQTVAAVVVVVVAVVKLRRLLRRVDQSYLGIEGEKRVAEVLDSLKAEGYRVINDIEMGGYNIDHVLIGPGGVFVIETKARSKHAGQRDVHVTYDGERVLENGHAPDRDPVAQVRGYAKDIARILEERTGKRLEIRPVVLYPGWFVDPQPRGVHVWVLNDLHFLAYVAREDRRLNEDEVRLLASALASFARPSGGTGKSGH